MNLRHLATDTWEAWLAAGIYAAQWAAGGEPMRSGIVMTFEDETVRVKFHARVLDAKAGVVTHNFGMPEDAIKLRRLMLNALNTTMEEALHIHVRREIATLPAQLEALMNTATDSDGRPLSQLYATLSADYYRTTLKAALPEPQKAN